LCGRGEFWTLFGVTLVDTHTHLDAAALGGSLPGLLERARAAGVAWMVAVGTAPDDWDLYRDLARDHPGCLRHTVGIHPCSVESHWAEWAAKLEGHWAAPGTPAPVALGECGLDRFHLPKDRAEAERVLGLQKAAFAFQLALARKVGCPLVIHSRGAFRECVEMIDASGVDWARVVFHCFSEGEAEMRELNTRGGRGSITGILTYKNADAVRAATRAQGLGRLMIETDAPFLAPVPHRGKTNEPAFLRHTAEYAASFLGVGLDELADRTTANARAFYGF
jgi:TatD DNase family protein